MSTESNKSGLQFLRQQRENQALVRLFHDEKLRSVDFSIYETIDEMIYHLGFNGSNIQKKAIANNFSIEDCLGFSSIKSSLRSMLGDEAYKTAIDFFKFHLEALADYFGTEFRGDKTEIAWTIYDNYHHLSVVDFLKFFEMFKLNELKEKTQHINARGINAEFIIDFLNKYLERREKAKKGLIEEARTLNPVDYTKLEPEDKEKIDEFVDKSKRLRIKKMNLASKERELRAKFEANRRIESDWQKLVRCLIKYIFSIINHDESPVEIENKAQNLALKLVDLWKLEFSQIESQQEEKLNEEDFTMNRIEELREAYPDNSYHYADALHIIRNERMNIYISKEYNDYIESDEIKYMRAQSKQLIKTIEKRFSLSAQQYITDSILEFAKLNKCENGSQLIELLSGEADERFKNDKKFFHIASGIARGIGQAFEEDFEKYRIDLLEKDELPLTRNEYLMRRARLYCLKKMKIDIAYGFLNEIEINFK